MNGYLAAVAQGGYLKAREGASLQGNVLMTIVFIFTNKSTNTHIHTQGLAVTKQVSVLKIDALKISCLERNEQIRARKKPENM